MAGNRNRPSMSMDMHSEHLRNLNYTMTGLKVDDAIENNGSSRPRRRRFSSAASSRSVGYNSGNRRDYDEEDTYYSERTRGYYRHNSDQMAYRNNYEDDFHNSAYYRRNSDQMANSYRNNNQRTIDPPRHIQTDNNRRKHRNNNTLRSSDTSSSTQSNPIQYNRGTSINNHRRYSSDSSSHRNSDDATQYTTSLPSSTHLAHDLSSPHGDVTIIHTDVQGSTSLWEACPSSMKKAQDVHDSIMRACYANHRGYEITTEGDAFILAFHHPVDALGFALEAQLKLYKASWPEEILNHVDGKSIASLKFRGFRVRFGVHHGSTTSKIHEMTHRTIYSGEAVKISKSIESMCHGGQILCTAETWNAVSGMAERYLGRPQVLDCGEHLLFEENSGGVTTRYIRRVMQLVPRELAFDFFEARGREDVDGKVVVKDASAVKGRLFPPISSKKQLSTGFLNAPYANGRVTICFVYTIGIDDAQIKEAIAKYVRRQLMRINPPGYECQEDNGCWMLAFDRMVNAVFFGLTLMDDLEELVELEGVFKVGIVTGGFTSMGPHKTTGMADYFGPIVNRAARVASNCQPGEVCVGIPLDDGVAADPPDFGSTVTVTLEEVKKLKGISIDTAIFSCRLSTREGYAY